MKKNTVIKVEKGSIAEEVGIAAGDRLLSVNGREVLDIFDYRYLIDDEYIEMLLRTPEGEEYVAEIEKDAGEDLGISFDEGLMDHARSCRNKCIFCFIDQLPEGMRDTLYFKDDDSRLSFLQGNYVTLTNMTDADLERIVYYHLSPINISVHTTDMELRKKMLRNRNAGRLFAQMARLAEAGIDMNLQIVLCRGVNDGAGLDRSIEELSGFYPRARSLSVVPAGMTRFREGLFPLEQFTAKEAGELLDQVERWQKRFKRALGTAFVFAADEFYITSGREFPSHNEYEDFPQIENGVGMASLLEHEFMAELKELDGAGIPPGEVSAATGLAAFELIKKLCAEAEKIFPQRKIMVYPVENKFFGEKITVAGLLTGGDIIAALKGKPLGEYLVLPQNLLRAGERVLLDDVTVEDIQAALGVPVAISPCAGDGLLKALMGKTE